MLNFRHKMIGLCLLALTAQQSHAQTTLLHYWSFNGVTAAQHNPSILPIHATYSVLDTNKANVVYQLVAGASSTYAGYIDNVTGDTMNARMSAPAGQGLRVRNPSDSMELRVYAPTTGYHGNISIKYEVQSSSTTSGQLAQLFDYSTDSGMTWKTSGLNMTIDSISQAQFQGTSWGLISLNFNNDTTVRNNAKFIFRIRFTGNTALTSGNNRFDNMTVESTVLVPQGVANVNGAQQEIFLYPNPAVSTLYIGTGSDMKKKVVLYSAGGQRMLSMQSSDNNVAVGISTLPAGVYYIYVTTGTHTDVKTFMKH